MRRCGCLWLVGVFALGVLGCGDEHTVETDATVDTGPDSVAPDAAPKPDAADAATDAAPPDIAADNNLPDSFTAPNTTCQTAIPIPLQNNTGTATGEIKSTDTDDNVTLTDTQCVGATTTGADRFYSVSLAAGQLYFVSVEGKAGFTPALYVFGDCNDVGGTCLDGATGDSNVQELAITPVQTGTYYIGVDSTLPLGSPGSYGQHKVTVSDRPLNDICGDAIALTWSGSTAKASGSLVGATNASHLNPGPIVCGGKPMMAPMGPDLFYALSVTAGKNYKVSLQPDSVFDGMVYVFTSCSDISGTCLMPGKADSVSFGASQTGTVYIAVDSLQTPTGPADFTLTAEELTPPANDQCSGATALTLTAGVATVTGDNSQAFDTTGQTQLSCMLNPIPAPGPDLFYALTPTVGKGYKVTLTSSAGSLMFYVHTSCSDIGGSCVTAAKEYFSPGKSRTVSFLATSNATHYITVDSDVASGGGPFTLTVQEVTPPANDQCSGATALTLTAGVATVTGDSSQAFDSTGQTVLFCMPGSSALPVGPDQFYALTPTVGKGYKVTPTSSAGDLMVYVLTSCNDISASCVAAAMVYWPYTPSFIATSASTHYIVVDSCNSSGGGPFTLDVEEFTPPANSTCANPQTLTLTGGSAIVNGDTALSANDLANVTCDGSIPFVGPQLYYKVALTQDKNYLVTLTSGALYAFPATTACTTSAVNAACANTCCDNNHPNGEIVGLRPATSGDWILVADSPAFGGKPFTLTVEEAPSPTSDTCAAAETITVPSTNKVTVSGHTLGATDTVNLPITGCTNNATAGPDVFYKVQLVASQHYVFNLSSSFDAALYLFTACADPAGTCSTGSDTLGGPGTEQLGFTPNLTQDYLLGVDGRGVTDTGAFTLDIAVEPAPPPP